MIVRDMTIKTPRVSYTPGMSLNEALKEKGLRPIVADVVPISAMSE